MPLTQSKSHQIDLAIKLFKTKLLHVPFPKYEIVKTKLGFNIELHQQNFVSQQEWGYVWFLCKENEFGLSFRGGQSESLPGISTVVMCIEVH